MANIKVVNENTVLVEDADDLIKSCKNPDDLQERVREVVNGPEIAEWEATKEQREEIANKMRELHALCEKAHVPMLFAAQVAYDKDGPTLDLARVGATDRTARRMDIMAGVYMLLLDGEDKIRELNAVELANFAMQIENLVVSRRIQKETA